MNSKGFLFLYYQFIDSFPPVYDLFISMTILKNIYIYIYIYINILRGKKDVTTFP